MAKLSLHPNAENATQSEMEAAIKCCRSRRENDRIRAMIALIMGIKREHVSRLFGVEARTVRRWIRSFNKSGLDGLIDKPKSGRPRKIAQSQVLTCRYLLDHPASVGEGHWTGVKFHGYLRKEMQIEAGYSTVIRFLREQDYRLKVPQPWPDRQDESLRQAFRRRLQELLSDPEVDLWFADETGIEGDPRPRRRWARRGEKCRVTKNGDHLRMNVTGMVCPRTGEFYALEFTHSDGTTFQAFLDEANKDVHFERKRQILILDNASWHKRKNLQWGRFEVLYLPPYSPDFNPIERLWLLMKAEWFYDFIAKNRQELIDQLDLALCWVINRKNQNKKTCALRT
jgi:putative transposase